MLNGANFLNLAKQKRGEFKRIPRGLNNEEGHSRDSLFVTTLLLRLFKNGMCPIIFTSWDC